jgi:hypothetical protein
MAQAQNTFCSILIEREGLADPPDPEKTCPYSATAKGEAGARSENQ